MGTTKVRITTNLEKRHSCAAAGLGYTKGGAMDGLDAWITGEGLCTYCGQRHCVCESEPDRDSDDCMDCGMCDSCIERTKAFFEEMEKERQ